MSTFPLPRLKQDAGLLSLVLTFLLLSSGPLAAQTFSRRYWDAKLDSLRQLLTTQHADTARLRTLMHLDDLGGYTSVAEKIPISQELVQLTRRLQRPEAAAYRLSYAWLTLSQAKAPLAQQLDSARATLAAFDRVGRPVPRVLYGLYPLMRALELPETYVAFFQAQAALYQRRGARENLYMCYRILGGQHVRQGDYNQGISYMLRAADLASTFSRYLQANELQVAGTWYADWGNPTKALHFLRQSLTVLAALPPRAGFDTNSFIYRGMAQAYRQLHDYPAALRYANLALEATPTDTTRRYVASQPGDYAHSLALKGALLLNLGRLSEARPLLARAQQLADSLQLALYNTDGALELDASWARYYMTRDEPARAEAYWRMAYAKARQIKRVPLQLAYLRGLADFYTRQGKAVPAARYSQAALALTDSLAVQQGAFHVAQYEFERADRVQQARIASLRQAQVQEAARARRQRNILWAVLGGAGLIAGFSFLLWRSNRLKQRANEQLNQLNAAVTTQKQELQSQRDQLDTSLTKLRATQAQLIQKEKMASLGELTAGIAHEIQNPLNFVTNFSDVSAELVEELQEALAVNDAAEATELAGDLAQNLTKISHHGRRASGIVKGMLEHSRTSEGERVPTNLNALADEYLRLAYQGLRATDKSFNVTLHTDYGDELPPVTMVGTDVGRVLLNLYSNAFYAVRQRQQAGEPEYQPTVRVETKRVNGQVEIRVQDNGTGIPAAVQAKIFQPFFTTKPPGEGTGLGLSLSYDIITQGHGGALTVDSQEGHGTTFTITFLL
ncbi:ATP-binding protein [Hymenobacter sp. BT188]|uniref:ATP-binding protein n=1 Tax=Hymenobacter sp. BT188 TaxID=2763504 RepID=UPI0021C6E0F5|nr:ATP-binding protein [Hymenobacter sp. BT188]